eukprot:2719182-Pyramimonas_sp.AAC.1
MAASFRIQRGVFITRRRLRTSVTPASLEMCERRCCSSVCSAARSRRSSGPVSCATLGGVYLRQTSRDDWFSASHAGYILPPLLRLVLTRGMYCLPSCDWF